jgi:hypothetical protein
MPAPPRPTARQVLLGALLIWQTFFLVTSNLAALSGGPPRNVVTRIDQRWAQAAYQYQVWGQYAPNIARHAIFVAVEPRWPDGSSFEQRSVAEPPDPLRFVQKTTDHRLALYEGDLIRPMWGWTARTMRDDPAGFRKDVSAYLRGRARQIVAYLDWRRRRFVARHPRIAPPAEWVLRVRVWVTPPHDRAPWVWSPPDDVPYARWRPGASPPAGSLPVEVYDPATGGFDFVTEKP